MAERRLEGLQRVLGVNALFSTAYGNVGSSIYYALGLVASFALGLTPVVFVIAGGIFYLTAATYAEATAMFPEAGGSSSFARHAFNELWSFFAARAPMLNYTISNMAEEAIDETHTIPRAIKAVVAAVFAIYAALPLVALSALPVTKQPDGTYSTLLGKTEAGGGCAGDPVLGIVKHLHLGALQ